MSIQITNVRYGVLPKTEQTISHYKWRDDTTGEVAYSDKPTLVTWIERGGRAYVGSGYHRVPVLVVDANPKYLRTYADGRWTNNLTELTEF